METCKDVNGSNLEKDEPGKTGTGFWKREFEMLKFKALYFLEFAHAGSIHPYIPFIARYDIGLSATSFSTAILLQKILAFLIKPSVGYIADYFKKIKLMILFLTAFGVCCFFLLSVIPKIETGALQRNETIFVISNCHAYHCNSNGTTINESASYVTLRGILLPSEANFSDIIAKGVSGNPRNTSEIFTIPTHKMFSASCDVIASNLFYSISERNKSECELLDCKVSTWDLHPEETSGSSTQQVMNSESSLLSEKNKFASCKVSKCSTASHSSDENATDDVPMMCAIPDSGTDQCRSSNESDECVFSANFTLDTCDAIPVCTANRSSSSGTVWSDFGTYQFYAFCLLCVAGMMTTDCVVTLIDTACLEQAKTTGHDFGRQAVWSSFGFGAVSVLMGYLVVLSGSYSVSYVVMAATGVATCAVAALVRYVRPGTSPSILSDFAVMARSEDFLFFAFGAFLNGVGYGAVVYHSYWYIDDIGGDGLVVGLTICESQFAKAAFFLVSGWILGLLDPHHVTSISILAYGVRCLSLSLLGNPYWVLAVEWMHGLTALYYHCAVAFAKSVARPGTENLVQSVMGSLYLCFGVALGAIIAGVGFDNFGGRKTYLVFGQTFGILAVANFLYTVNLNRRRRKKKVVVSTVT